MQAQPNFAQLTSMHFYAWRRGLKTGMYYLHQLPPSEPDAVTVDPATLAATALARSARPAAASTAAVAATVNNTGSVTEDVLVPATPETDDDRDDDDAGYKKYDANDAVAVCRRNNKRACLSCSS